MAGFFRPTWGKVGIALILLIMFVVVGGSWAMCGWNGCSALDKAIISILLPGLVIAGKFERTNPALGFTLAYITEFLYIYLLACFIRKLGQSSSPGRARTIKIVLVMLIVGLIAAIGFLLITGR